MSASTLPSINFKSLILAFAMLASAGLAVLMTPKQIVADKGPKINLEAMIPKQFGDWKLDEAIVPLLADPTQTALLDKIYNQILARTYVNEKGQRIMLSIAYGDNQTDSMQAHKPEVCYPAQGFHMSKNIRGTLITDFGSIAVRHLIAQQGARIEPITYWFLTGGKANVGGLDRKIAQLRFGLTGKIPDGMLFRVSNIDKESDRSFGYHSDFVNSLLANVSDESRARLIGN